VALAAAWADPDVVRRTAVPAVRDVAAATRWIAGEAERRAQGLALDLVVASGGGRDVLGEVGLARFDRPGAGGRPAAAGGGRFVGAAGRAEIGFWTAPAARGRGLATVAVRLVAAWVLTPPAGTVPPGGGGGGGLGLRRVWARTAPGDDRAGGVLRGAGFTRRGEAAGSVVWIRDAARVRA
jgi:RimJ/RimL family protein N-acetyltransferase